MDLTKNTFNPNKALIVNWTLY